MGLRSLPTKTILGFHDSLIISPQIHDLRAKGSVGAKGSRPWGSLTATAPPAPPSPRVHKVRAHPQTSGVLGFQSSLQVQPQDSEYNVLIKRARILVVPNDAAWHNGIFKRRLFKVGTGDPHAEDRCLLPSSHGILAGVPVMICLLHWSLGNNTSGFPAQLGEGCPLGFC